ncbi:hypothetical protein [Flavobacterium sp.]|uniref:hypothetical protein n=1 Tax=Flavobacterium sp. TaxID=239 RepID=UPI0039E4714C
MKMYVQNLAMLSAVIAFGCQSKQAEPQAEPQTEAIAAETDTMVQQPEAVADKPANDTKTIDGIVKEIANGKDGYTATIETKDQGLFKATISRANLTDAKQYRTFNVSEIVKLSGDYWKMGEEQQLTVREIQ